MKKTICIHLVAVLLFLISIPACRKSADAGNQPGGINKDTTIISMAPYPQTLLTNCPGAPNYGDSIIYLQPTDSDYIVKPINNPDTGRYFAWPGGMMINMNTGAINVSKSEGGVRYNIGYVKKGTTDTCMQTLILAGTSYLDSIYVLNNGERYAYPYFDANPNLVSVCSGNGGPGGGGSPCIFDVNNQGANQNVHMNKKTGVIDLKNTLNAFGLIPLNGSTVRTTIAYKLNNRSNMAMQQITLDLIYYNRKSDVPADLLLAVTDKLNKIQSGALLMNLLSSANNRGNPRPPMIIITRYN